MNYSFIKNSSWHPIAYWKKPGILVMPKMPLPISAYLSAFLWTGFCALLPILLFSDHDWPVSFAWNALAFQTLLKISAKPAKVCAWAMQVQLLEPRKKCRISVPTSDLLSLNLHSNYISRWFLCTFKSGKHHLSTPLHLASLLLHWSHYWRCACIFLS